MSTSSRVLALRSRDPSSPSPSSSSSSAAAVQAAARPVFKKDVPPLPPVSQPASASVAPAQDVPVRGGKPGSIYASYKALPYNTKLVFWTCGASKSTSPSLFLSSITVFTGWCRMVELIKMWFGWGCLSCTWVGCGVVFAALGLLAADKLEELFPAHNNKNRRSQATSPDAEVQPGGAKFIPHLDPTQAQDETAKAKPKLFSISVVDRS